MISATSLTNPELLFPTVVSNELILPSALVNLVPCEVIAFFASAISLTKPDAAPPTVVFKLAISIDAPVCHVSRLSISFAFFVICATFVLLIPEPSAASCAALNLILLDAILASADISALVIAPSLIFSDVTALSANCSFSTAPFANCVFVIVAFWINAPFNL